MKTIFYTEVQTKKVGKKFTAETSFNYDNHSLDIGYVQWGDTEQQAIDKVMKFLSSDGKYDLKCKDS